MTLKASVRGTGQPVVMLHSGGMSSRQWKRLGDELETTHKVVAPDLLGSGENEPWPVQDAFDFSMDVDAVAEIVSEPTHLVGHSYGGLVALTVARRYPERVRSLVVYDPVAFGVIADDPEGAGDLARVGQSRTFTDDAIGGDEKWFEEFVDYWNAPGAWQKLPQQARDGFLRVGRKVFYEVRSLMKDRTAASQYAHVSAPTLLLTGEHTPVAARRVVEILAHAMPHATLQRIDGAGHMGPISHAPVVNALIAAHVRAAS